MKTMPHPLMPKAVDVLMMVGKEYYTVPAFIREAQEWGVSKRIPPKAIPEGIVPGVSRMFLWHPEAIPLVTAEDLTLHDLVQYLLDHNEISEGVVVASDLAEPWAPGEHLLPADYVPPTILTLTMCIQDLPPAERGELERHFKIVWQGGVFCYTVLGQVEYVVREGETELPDDVARLGNIVRPVVVQYTDGDDAPIYEENAE